MLDAIGFSNFQVEMVKKIIEGEFNPMSEEATSEKSISVASKSTDATSRTHIVDDDYSGLTLGDVLDTPELFFTFSSYIKSVLCLENLTFIQSIRAYKEMNMQQRKSMAPRLYEWFIAEGSKSQINISSGGREMIKVKLQNHDYTNDTFKAAYDAIYHITEKDVFKRFLDKHSESVFGNLGSRKNFFEIREEFAHLRRKNSYIICPFMEDRTSLSKLAQHFVQSSAVKTHVKGFNRYSTAFKGFELIDWLLKQDHQPINWRIQCISVAQRMMAARIFWPLVRSQRFQDGDDMYTFEQMERIKKSVAQLMVFKLKNKEIITMGWLLLKDVRYLPVYCMYREKKAAMYIFPCENSKEPLFAIKGMEKNYTVKFSRSDVNEVSYMHMVGPKGITYDFRINSQDDKINWLRCFRLNLFMQYTQYGESVFGTEENDEFEAACSDIAQSEEELELAPLTGKSLTFASGKC